MKYHTHITSIKRTPWLKGQIHVLVSAEVGQQPCNFRASAQDFCCEQWLPNFPTRFFLYCHVSKCFTNSTFTHRASLQYLVCVTPFYRAEKKQPNACSFHCLLMLNFRHLKLNLQNMLGSQYNSSDFAAAEQPAFLHIHPTRCKCVWEILI